MKKLLIYGLVLMLTLSMVFATTNDAIIYYSFDDADITADDPDDLSGNGNDGVGMGNPTTGEVGAIGEAFLFDGTGDFINTTWGANETNTAYTVAMFFKSTSSDTFQSLVVNKLSANDQMQVRLGDITQGDIRYYEKRNGGSADDGRVSASYNDGEWYHICAASTAASTKFVRVNGTTIDTGTADSGVYNWREVWVGARNDGTPADEEFYGHIDEFALYDRALSEAECDALAAANPYAGAPPVAPDDTLAITAQNTYDDSTINAFNASIYTNGIIPYGYGNVTYATGINGGAAEFDGVDAYVTHDTESPEFETYSEFTLATWTYLAHSDIASTQALLGKVVLSTDPNNIGGLYINSVQDEFRFRLSDGVGGADAQADNSISPGWHHVVGTWDGATMKLYINGSLQTDTGAITSINNISRDFVVGANHNKINFFFNGTLDDAYVFNRALTQTNITDLFSNPSTHNQTDYVASYFTDEYFSTGQMFNTTNGTLYINISEITGGDINATQNVSVFSPDSFTSYYTEWNINSTLAANLTDSDIKFNLYELLTGSSLAGYIFDNYSNQTNGTTFGFSVGEHTVLAYNITDHFDLNFTFNVSARQNSTVNITGIFDSWLKINATDSQTGIDITTFNITLRGLNNSYDDFSSTTTGDIYFGVKKDLSYTAYINDTLHAVTLQNVTADSSYTNLTMLISSINSVLMTFVDEFFGTTINGVNMTAQFVGTNAYAYTTTTGTIFAELITPSDYEIRYYSTNIDDYKLRSYFFTLTNLSFNNITLYSLNTSSDAFTKATITFQVLDTNFAPVEDARVVVQRYYAAQNGFVTVFERLTNTEGEAVGEFETIDAFYRYLIYYNDNLEFASSTNGVQFNADDTLTIYIDTSQGYAEGISSIHDLADVSNLEFQSTGNFSGFFELNYTNDNLIQICLEVRTVSDLVSWECQTTASGTIQSTVNAPTTRTSNYFARAVGYDTSTGQYVIFDSTSHTFNFDELISQNAGIKSAATFVVIIILVGLALLLIKFPVISMITQTVFFAVVTLSPLPLIVGDIAITIAWLVMLTVTGVYILMRGKNG